MMERVKNSKLPKLNILVCNVCQDNQNFERLLALAVTRDPDIIFLLETDDRWLEGVKELREKWPHRIEIPLGNTYGMLFYSKLPLENHEVNYLVDPEIPSIIADVKFDKYTVRLYGLHPTPPVPQENKYSTDRDAEILMVAKMAKKHEGPCMVLGDLNDVAWSYTTELFLKISGMLDPRRGRGIYSTFNANHMLLRWPLDHYFLSSHFRLVDMKVERHVGSDHFPISICLVIAEKDDHGKMEADSADKKLANEKIAAGNE